jgi:hypothetical protein
MNERQSVFIGFILGLLTMISIAIAAEPQWIEHARKSKVECEENIPRKEVCVPVFFPRSKD